MDLAAYSVEAEVEETHWWFVGRRRLFGREISGLGLSKDAPVLDVGTSTGTNLRMLAELGYRRVVGLDLSNEAIRFCAEKGLGVIHRGDVCDLPFEDASLDLVLATDIIEHVEDDRLALSEIARVLVPGGSAMITVPAFQCLWGLQDEVSHHLRRYRMAGLRDAVEGAGLRPVRCFHFNYLLFAPIWLARQILRMFNIRVSSESQVNTTLLNRLLLRVFDLDVRTAPWLAPPFGVSIFLLAEKPTESEVGERSHDMPSAYVIRESEEVPPIAAPQAFILGVRVRQAGIATT
jgi:SAM-dependent methyltransferase